MKSKKLSGEILIKSRRIYQHHFIQEWVNKVKKASQIARNKGSSEGLSSCKNNKSLQEGVMKKRTKKKCVKEHRYQEDHPTKWI